MPSENAIVAATNSARHTAGDGGHGGEFVKIDVAAFFANDFVAVMGPDLDGDEIAHAAGGNEQGGFFAEDFGGTLLEEIDGGIFTVDVVADGAEAMALAHFVAGTSDGVAAKIDGVFDGQDVIRIDELIAFGDGVGHVVLRRQTHLPTCVRARRRRSRND